MTVEEFIAIQGELMLAYGWVIRWWLIAFFAGLVLAAIILWIVVVSREMISKI